MLRPFTLHRPASLGDIADLLDAHGSEAALYAGGTELLLLMKEGLLRPRHLIDVKRVVGLDALAAGADGTITIGAVVPHRAVETSPLVREHLPLLAGVARHVANARVRSVGTVGGNLAFADPHSDLATVLLTLDATVQLWSRRGERVLPLADFIRDAYETARDDDEVLTGVCLRAWPAGTAAAYVKFGIHERPTLGVAVALVPIAGGAACGVRLAIGCVGPRPERFEAIERLAGEGTPSHLADRADELATAAAGAVEPVDDRHGSAEYKREMTRVFVRRALQAAIARAEGRESHARYAHTVSSCSFALTVNGRVVTLDVPAHALLLDVLRDRLGLKGAKRSCDVQVCGACTVLVGGAPVSACTYLAAEADGREVLTIEGLAHGDALHPLQEAFIEHGAVQCGFCTSGMLLSAKALLDEDPAPTRERIEQFLRGNLCRCTGYRKIVDAIEACAAGARARA